MEQIDVRDDPGAQCKHEGMDDSKALPNEIGREMQGNAPWSRSGTDTAYRERMHRALDDLLDRIEARRNCIGDRRRSGR